MGERGRELGTVSEELSAVFINPRQSVTIMGRMPRVTNRERVLLALEEAREHAERYEVPRRFSQVGLAGRLGMAQSHVSRALKGLDDEALLTSERRRVSGERRRVMAYGLTEKGQDIASDLFDELHAVEILTEGEDGTLDLLECESLFSRWRRKGWRSPADALALTDLLRSVEQHDGHPRMDVPPELHSVDESADLSSETIGLHLELADLRRSQDDDEGAIEHLHRAAELHRKRGSIAGEARCLLAAATLGAELEEPLRFLPAVEGIRDHALRIDSLLILHDLTESIIPLARAWALGPTLPLAGHIGFRLSSLQSPGDARETLMILRSIFESAGDSNGEEICKARLAT